MIQAIEIHRSMLLDQLDIARNALMDKTTAEIVDLQHTCDELRHNEDWTTRAAAEINHTACGLALESRAPEMQHERS